jgi:sulfur-oxidizing protein SoxZ
MEGEAGDRGHRRRLQAAAGKAVTMRENRIRVPKEAAAGEIVEVRAMIMHPMETGFNVDDQGAVITVNIVAEFKCVYDGREVFRARLEPGLSANPLFIFHLRATRTAPVEFLWRDQDGDLTTASATLTVR